MQIVQYSKYKGTKTAQIDQISTAKIVTLLLSLVFFFQFLPVSGFYPVSLLAAILLITSVAVANIKNEFSIKLNLTDITILLMLIWWTINYFFISNFHLINIYYWQFLTGFMLYFTIRFAKDKIDKNMLLNMLRIAISANIFYFLIQFFGIDNPLEQPYRSFGLLGGTSQVAISFSMMIIVLLYLKEILKNNHFLDTVLLVLIFSISLLLRSRSLILVYLLFVGYKMYQSNIRKWIKISITLLSGLIAIFLIQYKISSFLGRLKLWEFSIGIFKESPITGGGIGQYGRLYNEQILSEVDRGIYQASIPNTIGEVYDVAFNDFVQIGCETGIIGCLLLVALFSILLLQNQFKQWLYPVSIAAIACFLFPFHHYFCVLLIFSLFALMSSNSAANYFFKVKKAKLALVLILIPIFGAGVLITYKCTLWKDAYTDFQQGRISEAQVAYKDIIHSLGKEENLLYDYSLALQKTNQSKKLTTLFEQINNDYPSYKGLVQLGNTYEQQHQLKAAIDAYQSAAAIRPFTAYPKYRLFYAYRKNGELRAAESIGQDLMEVASISSDPLVREMNEEVIAIQQK